MIINRIIGLSVGVAISFFITLFLPYVADINEQVVKLFNWIYIFSFPILGFLVGYVYDKGEGE